MNAEEQRLKEEREGKMPWKKWGPYLSERQWGTVREDYSPDGEAWDYFPYSHSSSRAYRWGEDGIGGISDDCQHLCFAVSLWNGNDSILKERLFGLSGQQGNHGEDVKEYYFYLDNTPTHSFMKYLYKYPHGSFPYEDLSSTNQQRSRLENEYELLETGIFEGNRYFDIFIEYAKVTPDDILIKVSALNHGPAPASIHILPTLWFRNFWSWGGGEEKPLIEETICEAGSAVKTSRHPSIDDYQLLFEGNPELLFVENETNTESLFSSPNNAKHVKDGINVCIVHGQAELVNPEKKGTKVAANYKLTVAAGKTQTIRMRLSKIRETTFDDFETVFQNRIQESNQFFAALSQNLSSEEKLIFRQALSGMLWSKQYYEFDVSEWLKEHHGISRRNTEWAHMKSHDILSMPDKWEYPWFAVWDTAFHAIALILVDPDFAKGQLSLFLEKRYQHPNGQIPAYEWNFCDVNPPVHAWAVRAVYRVEKERLKGNGDLSFLKKSFDQLEKNFEWWEENKGNGDNVYKGGFLGLDNIGVFDRSAELPTGGHLEQSDGTAWMVLYAQNMIQISLELAKTDKAYEVKALKYLDKFIAIASAMDMIGESNDEMWDEEDGFFYDVLRFPDGSATRLKIRSLVGLLPLCAATVIEQKTLDQLPKLTSRYEHLMQHKEELTKNIACPICPGEDNRRLLAILDEEKLRKILARMLDEDEFLSPYGIRSLSKYHQANPYVFDWAGETYTVSYLPGESDTGMFGGNSNWRGPVWIPVNFLIIHSLLYLYTYYGKTFQVECPTGSRKKRNLYQVAEEISRRLMHIFLPDSSGVRPVFGGASKFQSDPNWKDYLLFYEYFHGENGSGLGASHQTGWTGTIASLIAIFGSLDHEDLIQEGMVEVVEALAGTAET